MDVSFFHSGFTLGLFITLVCIYLWAYSKPKQALFEQVARSIFSDKREHVSSADSYDNDHDRSAL